MLINFTIENFLSFRDKQRFSMIAGLGGKNKAHHVIPKTHSRDVRLVKTGVIFGANASGKSNLVKAIHTGQKLVLQGNAPFGPIKHTPFKLDDTCLHKPTTIEFEIKHRGRCYAYGFAYDAKEIKEEWLYRLTRNSEKMLFERKGKVFELGPLLKKNPQREEQQFLEFMALSTPVTALFLSDVQQRNTNGHVSDLSDLQTVFDWFKNALTIVYPKTKALGLELAPSCSFNEVYKEFLSYFDTGITDIVLQDKDIQQITFPKKIKQYLQTALLDQQSEKTFVVLENPNDDIRYLISKANDYELKAQKICTVHQSSTIDALGTSLFEACEESDGTQRIMDFIPILIDLFKEDNVFVVDEVDRSLHPNLVYELFDLFLESSKGIASQFITTSHSANILTQDLLRKDEIWFVDKDTKGASAVYSLDEYKMDIRYDKHIQKDYLIGRYGGIPQKGNRFRLQASIFSDSAS